MDHIQAVTLIEALQSIAQNQVEQTKAIREQTECLREALFTQLKEGNRPLHRPISLTDVMVRVGDAHERELESLTF